MARLREVTILSKHVEDELADSLRNSVERVEGKSYILQRKIFVILRVVGKPNLGLTRGCETIQVV